MLCSRQRVCRRTGAVCTRLYGGQYVTERGQGLVVWHVAMWVRRGDCGLCGKRAWGECTHGGFPRGACKLFSLSSLCRMTALFSPCSRTAGSICVAPRATCWKRTGRSGALTSMMCRITQTVRLCLSAEHTALPCCSLSCSRGDGALESQAPPHRALLLASLYASQVLAACYVSPSSVGRVFGSGQYQQGSQRSPAELEPRGDERTRSWI